MTDELLAAQNSLITLTADIVAAHLSYNMVPVAEVAGLIAQVHGALSGLGTPSVPAQEELKPAVPVRSSVKPDHIICLEDGKKLKMLKRHLMTHYQNDARRLSQEVEPARRLSDGRAGLCSPTARSRHDDWPGSEAEGAGRQGTKGLAQVG